jgi:purine-binding chemotaxis protein CheW
MSDNGTRQLVVFTLGAEEYALPITRVQEIIRYADPRPVAAREPWLKGVISLRGKIIPVCDLASRLGLSTAGAGGSEIVVVETQGEPAGVIVGNVEEVLTLDEAQLETVPGSGNDLVEEIAKVGDRLVVLLNPDGIFAESEMDAAVSAAA